MRHVDGVRLENVRLRYVGNKEARPAIVTDDATFTADDLCEFQPPAGGSAVRKYIVHCKGREIVVSFTFFSRRRQCRCSSMM